MPQLTDFLPTTKKEIELRGWTELDIIIFSADAYVDHPSFGAAVIGRVLEAEGYKVAIVPQPDWHGDYRDFRKLGKPRLFFAVAPGCMDSMVNKYTARRRLRSEDAYSPDGRHDCRPEYPTIVYTRILKELYPDTPVILGGIEASMRRLTHYDYWQDALRPCILVDSHADMIVYGMGERPMRELSRLVASGTPVSAIRTLPQTVILAPADDVPGGISDDDITLHSHERCLSDKKAEAENYRHIEEQSNRIHAQRLLQLTGDRYVVVNRPYPVMTTAELDAVHALPFTRLPHPKYKGKRIPAYDMIKFSVNTHRGCFGGCNFCTIAAHQGKFIQSRSEESILKEIAELNNLPGFAGNISDVGAPTANMYGMHGKDVSICERCRRKSCLFPSPCKNLDRSHERLLRLYSRIAAVKGIRHAYIGSGIRYDLFLDEKGFVDESSRPYLKELILDHTAGRLKVAPEHTEDCVLKLMAKPSFRLFERLRKEFDAIVSKSERNCELVPYFISSHPGCGMREMESLSRNPALKGLYMDQVQDFTPTPMTTSSVMFYTGLNPSTMEKVFVERNPDRKKQQKSFFFRKKGL